MTNQPLRRRNADDPGYSGQTANPSDLPATPSMPTIDGWMHRPRHAHAAGHAQPPRANDPWQVYQSRNFADIWYGARSAGERLRALALERLYRNRPYPGGPHPDPREPSAFSSQAVLSVAASLVSLEIDASDAGAISGSHGSHGWDDPGYDPDLDEETGRRLPFAWIMTYPSQPPAPPRIRPDSPHTPPHTPPPGALPDDQPHPQIILRSLHADQRLMEFEIACLVGYWHHDYDRLADPDAPTGAILLPHDPGITTILHQYAIALLCLPRDCPDAWTCHCNAIRARFNAPPPDHPQPTGQTPSAELLAEARRQRRATEPRFPYADNNAWTDE